MTAPRAGKLAELLDQQVAALEAVLDVLTREQTALQLRDAAVLESLTAQKQERLATAAALELRRRELAPTPAAMDHLAESPGIAARWAQLLDLTRACRDHNEANGRIIRRQQRRVESALTLLRGRGDQPKLYGPDGESRGKGPSRQPITSA
jgi:flagella synthesis protein FlgN